MTNEDIIRMAEYAGSKMPVQLFQFTAEELERFAAIVAAHERKALSGTLLDYAGRNNLSDSDKSRLKELLDLIRAWGGA
jgi:hypothetical protein